MSLKAVKWLLILALMGACGEPIARAVEVGVTTNFSNGISGFDGGGLSVEASGGPNGDGDAYLRINATGGNGPGSRLATFNTQSAFVGNFKAAGVTALEVDLRNFAETPVPLNMRLALLGPDNANANRFTSINAIDVPNDGQWRTYTFPISSEALTRVAGTTTFDQMFSQVRRIILRHDVDGASAQGSPIAGTMGIDNIRFVAATFAPSDFNRDGLLDVADINLLLAEVRAGTNQAAFDRTADGQVNDADIVAVVTGPSDFNTFIGDSNLDREFNTGDLVFLFQAGQYEDAIADNSDWSTGDWTGDGDFDTADLLFAFQQGGFEQGPRAAVAAVPEPSSLTALLVSGLFVGRSFVKRRGAALRG